MRAVFAFCLVAVLGLSAFTPSHRMARVELTNESDFTITYVYASTCDQDSWGEDLLGNGVVGPGESGTITMPPGCWDFRAIVDDEVEFQHFGISLDDDQSESWTISNE
jgi:hypothetical protein